MLQNVPFSRTPSTCFLLIHSHNIFSNHLYFNITIFVKYFGVPTDSRTLKVSGLILFWREFASSRRPWNYCKISSLNQEEHAAFAKTLLCKNTLRITENPFLLRIVLPTFIPCVLMSTLCSVLALASSIGWLMSQLASEMFFLHYLLLITQL